MELSFPKNINIAAAVSGGVDSMVMLSLFLEAGIRPLVVSVDHGIRGEESAADAEFVKKFAEEHGLSCEIYRVDVPGAQKESGLSTELQARILRYEVFQKILSEGRADAIALAHHLGDQAETVLMRIMRGTGVRGLVGITDREGYIHPLLSFTRAEIERYAFQNSVPFREDKTNLWDGYLRNFVRMRVLPVVSERCENIEKQTEKLCRSARETEDFIAEFLTPAEKTEDGLVFPEGIFEAHDAVLKRSLLKGLASLGIYQDIEEPALTAVCELKAKTSGGCDIGAGLRARREYGKLYLERNCKIETYEKLFLVTETYTFGNRYEFLDVDGIVRGATFDADKIPIGAVVRTRRSGDRFRKYKGGDNSLSDYFTDIKMPKRDRDRQLLLASEGRIYAVLGVEIADEAKCDGATKRKITVKRSSI